MRVKSAVPIKPIITPMVCRFVVVILNKAKPSKIVFKGVNEFKIEATALSISVSAMAKKNAKKNAPKNPEIINHFQCFFYCF